MGLEILANKSIGLVIPDFEQGGEEKRILFFANNYINYFKKVFLFAPQGTSVKQLHIDVQHIPTTIRGYRSLLGLVKQIKNNNIDFIQGHKRATLPYLFALEKLTNAKVNFNFDSYYTDKTWLYRIAPKRIYYLSDDMKAYYSRWFSGKENITINMGGEFLQPPAEAEMSHLTSELNLHGKFVLLSLGRLSPEKNQALLFKALHQVANDSFVCLVVGGGPDEEKLKSLAKDLGIECQVRFLGYRKDIAALLSVSHALVQTSNQEGFPNVFIEAASLARPIITTKVGSFETLVGSNGISININDVEGLVNAIRLMQENYTAYHDAALQLKNSEFFQQFHKSKMLENYLLNYSKDSLK